MKYDDAEFAFLNFETDLDNGAANTHIGMYLAWAIGAGLANDDETDPHWTESVSAVKARRITGGQLLSDWSDCKLMDSEFNAEGNAFTAAYYEKGFVRDYERVLKDQMPSTGHETDDFCSVPDTWANFDRLKPLLDRRLAAWRAAAGGTPAAAAPEPSVDELKRRAQAGDRDAWFALGAEYITGTRLPRDFAQAAAAFEKAAQAGLPEAAFNLGVCYQNGDGRPQDAQQMLRWFSLAAEGGHGQATYMLAMAYRSGQHVPQDFVASNALMLLAQQRGVEAAQKAGVMAGSIAESVGLAEELRKPDRLVAVLAARRRAVSAGRADSGVERWKNPGASRAAAPAEEPEPEESPPAKPGLGYGHLALMIGAAGVFVLLQGHITGSLFRTYALLFGLVGAAGVFTVGRSLGFSEALRLLLTLLAMLPVVGSFVSLGVVVRWLLLRRSG